MSLQKNASIPCCLDVLPVQRCCFGRRTSQLTNDTTTCTFLTHREIPLWWICFWCFLFVCFLARQATTTRSMSNLYIETSKKRHVQVVHTGRRLTGPRAFCVIRYNSRKSPFLRLPVGREEKIIHELFLNKQPAVTTPKSQESLELVIPSFFAGPLKYSNIEKD